MTTLPAVGGRDLARYLPIVAWLPRYRRSALPRDLIAAITVWALVVPQAIAYAQIAGLPPQQGLFAAAGGLLGYGLMGTCRQLIVSPTSSTAAISASLVGAIALGDVTKLAPLSSALAILCGVTFVLLGLLRLGFVSRFIPAAVQVGFMFGLGMTIIVGQLTKILGVPESSGTFLEQTRGLLADLGDTNLWTVALGVVALALLLGGPRRAPGLPWALIVVVGGIVAVALLGLADKGVAVIGLVDGAFPLPAIPAIAPQDLFALVPGAIAIAVVGSAESLTVAQSFAEEHRYEIDPDQELRANGAGNLVSGLLQGFIVGGGASQSAAAERAGASSPIVSLMVAALTVITSVALLPLFQDLPQPVLGAIVISAVIGFLRVAELRRIAALRRDAFLLALVALGATLVLGILSGLIVTVLLALVLLLASFARPEASVMGQDPSGELVSLARVPGAATLPGVLVLRLDAPLLFLNAGTLHDRVSRASTGMDPRPSVVVLDLSMSADLDIGSLDVLGRLDERLRNEGAELRLVHVHRLVQDVLARAAALGTRTPPIYATMADAVDLERGGGLMTDMDGSAVAGSAEPAPPMPGVASPDATAGDVVVPARFLPLQLPSAPFWVVLIAGIAAVVLVVAASSALFVFAIGIALSFFLVPVVNWLVRHGIPRIGASILVVVVLVLITLTALLIGAYILIDQGTAFVQSLPSLFADLKADFDALELPTWLEEAVTAVGTTLQSTLANLDWGAWIIGLVQGVLGMVGLFFSFMLLPFFLFYLLKDQPRMSGTFYRNVPEPWKADVSRMITICVTDFAQYFKAEILVGAIMFCIVSVGMVVFGTVIPDAGILVSFALLLGLAAFVFELIPRIGPILSYIPALLLAATVSPVAVAVISVFYFIIFNIEGSILVPTFEGKMISFSGASVLLLIAMGFALAGIIGAIIALPVAAIARDLFGLFFRRAQEQAGLPPPEAPDAELAAG